MPFIVHFECNVFVLWLLSKLYIVEFEIIELKLHVNSDVFLATY